MNDLFKQLFVKRKNNPLQTPTNIIVAGADKKDKKDIYKHFKKKAKVYHKGDMLWLKSINNSGMRYVRMLDRFSIYFLKKPLNTKAMKSYFEDFTEYEPTDDEKDYDEKY